MGKLIFNWEGAVKQSLQDLVTHWSSRLNFYKVNYHVIIEKKNLIVKSYENYARSTIIMLNYVILKIFSKVMKSYEIMLGGSPVIAL